MKVWTLSEAKAHLSSIVAQALDGKPQRIVRRGRASVVVISDEAYDAATKPKESLVEFFARSPHRDIELNIKRAQDMGRNADL